MTKAASLTLGFIFLLASPGRLPAQTSAVDMAVKRAVYDQANTIVLRQKLEGAKAAAARGDLAGAAELYQEAYALTEQIGSGIDAETAQTISGLAATRLELARRAQSRGDLIEANTQVTDVLNVDSQNSAALAFKKQNDQMTVAMQGKMPSASTLEQIPVVHAQKTQAATLVQDGKVLYEMGRLQEAEAKLQQALKLDPDNEGAFYYMNLIQQANFNREGHQHDNDTQIRMETVEHQWVRPDNSVTEPNLPNPYARTNLIFTGPGRESIVSKLDRIQMDTVSWPDGLPLSEVIRNLYTQSRLRDPDKTGINFLWNGNGGDAAAGGAAAGGGAAAVDPNTGLPIAAAGGGEQTAADDNNINIKLTLNNVRLADVLDAIVMVADHPIKYSILDYGIVFSPRGAETPTLYTRTFRVDANTFYQGLQSVGAFTFGSANNNSGNNGNGGGGYNNGGNNNGGNNNNNNNNNNGNNGSSSGGSIVPVVNVAGGGGGGGNGGGRGGAGGVGGAGGAGGANGGGGLAEITRVVQMETVSVAAQTFFKTLGVDLTLPGKNIFFNDRLGKLFVRGTAQDLDTIESAIETLDQVPPMVRIKARFIEVEQDDNAALGFDWYLGQFGSTVTASGGSEASQTVPVSAANPLGIFPGNTVASAIAGSAGDQLITGGLENSGPALATITGIMTDPNFRVVLHALQQRSGFEELNEPEVTVISGRQTQMKATDIQYILTGFEFDTGVTAPAAATPTGTIVQSAANSAIEPDTQQFEIGPTLDVVPVVLSDGYTINLTLIPELLEFDQYDPVPTVPGYTPAAATSSGGVSSLPTVLPHFTVRDVVTTVNIWDNQTIGLGGLIASTIQNTKDTVPFIGNIPLLGRLFQSQTKVTEKKNLMIFVTATIIDPAGNRVHSDDELPFAQNAIPSQPVVPDQVFYPGPAASVTNALTN